MSELDLPKTLRDRIDKIAGPLGYEILMATNGKELLAPDILDVLVRARIDEVLPILHELESEDLVERSHGLLDALEAKHRPGITESRPPEVDELGDLIVPEGGEDADDNGELDVDGNLVEDLLEQRWQIMEGLDPVDVVDSDDAETCSLLVTMKKGPVNLKTIIEGWSKSTNAEVRIATIRKTLYDLAKMNVMDSRSERMSGGKIIYHWRVTVDKAIEREKKRIQVKIDRVDKVLSQAADSNVFVCDNCEEMYSFEDAMTHEFVCPKPEGTIYVGSDEEHDYQFYSCDNCGKEVDQTVVETVGAACPHCVCKGEIINFDDSEKKERFEERKTWLEGKLDNLDRFLE